MQILFRGGGPCRVFSSPDTLRLCCFSVFLWGFSVFLCQGNDVVFLVAVGIESGDEEYFVVG